MTAFDVDQDGWGSETVYPDNPEFRPRYVVIHWGGSTSSIPPEDEAERLRIWQRYHMYSRGWQDIAYNYAIGDSGTIYRCRGMNPGGHTSGADDRTPEGDSYNLSSIGVVWIGGSKAGAPSDAAKASMGRLIRSSGIESVKGHRQVKVENGSTTACPGGDWLQWVYDEEWKVDMEALKAHLHMMVSAAFSSGNPAVQGVEQVWHDLIESNPLSPEFQDLYRTAWK